MRLGILWGPLSWSCLGVVLSPLALAANISGRVVDSHGEAVAEAEITIVELDRQVSVASDGSFSLTDLPETIDEIHIAAPGYSHRVFHLHEGEVPATVVLQVSVIEQVDVIGLPLHASQLESVQPVSVVSTEDLRRKQGVTLGDTLKKEVGVQATAYGRVASRPIIRGLDGPRVLITENGLDTGDVSSVGPDHAVTAEASTARQVEILRGPATLFYGSGAIGGVVNVVDDRVPRDSEPSGQIQLSHNTVADEDAVSGAVTTGGSRVAVHLDGYWRDGDNYRIPVPADRYADHHDEHRSDNRLANSFTSAQGATLGASWLLDSGFVGLSYGDSERKNGIPGHGAEDHDEHEEETAVAVEEHDDEQVSAHMEQRRWQLLGEWQVQSNWLEAVHARGAYTDYQHQELHQEDGVTEVGTRFDNTSSQARVDLLHQEWLHWRGALSLEWKDADFRALGEEAFTPPSNTRQLALSLVEERHMGGTLWQLGARVEDVRLQAEPGELEIHDHDGEATHPAAADTVEFSFTPFSVSAGLVWDLVAGVKSSVSLTHAQRAPSAAEVLALGPHIGTRTFEVGAGYDLHLEDGEWHIDADGDVDVERSNNIDLSLKKYEGNTGFVINLFYNQVDNFYFQEDTGLTSEDLLGHEAGDSATDEHGHGALPVFHFRQGDVALYGVEAEWIWQLPKRWHVTLWADSVRGRLRNGDNLPRIPPVRVAAMTGYEHDGLMAELQVVHNFEQDKTGLLETPTDAFTMVDFNTEWQLPGAQSAWTAFFKVENLTNTEARAHSSFLKDQAPLPGRGITVGLRGTL